MPDNNLLKNKLLLQYLSGAGSALSSGQPVAPALDQISQQNISSQNYAKLLQGILKDAASPDSTSKVTFDGSKLKFDADLPAR